MSRSSTMKRCRSALSSIRNAMFMVPKKKKLTSRTLNSWKGFITTKKDGKIQILYHIQIGDLGLSKVKQHTLVSGGVCRTLPWMAPEPLSGKSNMVTKKIDVYLFGIVMWELLTGDEPYADMHCASIIGFLRVWEQPGQEYEKPFEMGANDVE